MNKIRIWLIVVAVAGFLSTVIFCQIVDSGAADSSNSWKVVFGLCLGLVTTASTILSYLYAGQLGRSRAGWAFGSFLFPYGVPLILAFSKGVTNTEQIEASDSTEHGEDEVFPAHEQPAETEAQEPFRLKSYYNEEWNFSIAYPSHWQIIWENEPAGSWVIPIAVAGRQMATGRPCFMVNVRRGEILQGSSNMKVSGMSEDGRLIEMPSTPQEYIEMNKQQLPGNFPGYQFISSQETRLANKPAARIVYSYDGQAGRIAEECITLFGVGVTFQFICEVPAGQFSFFGSIFKDILESFRIGRATPEDVDTTNGSSDADLVGRSPILTYNRGACLYHSGEFEKALKAFDQCFDFGECQLQAAYARALCQQELGLEIEFPEELGDKAAEAGPVYVASNLVCHLIEEGHQAALTKHGGTSEVQADVNGAHYLVSITSGFGFGGFFKMAWRKDGEKSIPVADSSANPNPTESDMFVKTLLESTSSLPPSSLPEEGLKTSL